MTGWHCGFGAAIEKLKESNEQNTATLFVHGTLKVMLYAPAGEDHQIPHERDEIYVVARGDGQFQLGESRFRFSAGDAIFVPAGVDHRFVDFSDDLVAWVLFYGPKGGEAV